ncbi:nitroreductase [Hydrogenophaga borbori]|uniref:Nitroreductase n=1 Tax=Hydrogenophaga borbori TaxID=2294117 RepID=A0A372EKA1_9BURK|nr:nitroreductase [Hydrogenophaga borbori]RFP79299.1 nitroreductase [Hydrogenophaga borbori]
MSTSTFDTTACLDGLLRSRCSVRAFRDEAVPRETVLEILRVASRAPSNSNTQPWQVYALAGPAIRELEAAIAAVFDSGQLPPPHHFPVPLPDEYGVRQADFAARYYQALGIDRSDAAARARQTRRNFGFFGAPVGLIFAIDACLKPHSWLDLGLFLQSVMLAARARGLDTCPQVSFAPYHAVIAPLLGMPDGQVTVCGLSLGYRDERAPVNSVETPRRGVDAFVRTLGF